MSSPSSSNACSRSRMTARELIQYPEAKRVTKKTAEESLFPSRVDVQLLRLDETCGVCLGDFREDEVQPSPPGSGDDAEAAEITETDVIEVKETDEEEGAGTDEICKDPLRDIGLLTGCTHTYHFFCIEKWGKQRENSCPQCKSRFSWIGRYSRSGRRICCCRVGLKNQKDTTEASIVDYVQLQQQQQLCQVCNTVIETPQEELRCSDQLCLNSFHYICLGFDALPVRTWFCPRCRSSGICRDAESRRVPPSRISPDGFLLPPRPRGRRAAAAAATVDGDRDALVENLSSEVIRRINRGARQQDGEEGAAQEAPHRRRSSRGTRETAAATGASGRRRERRQQQQRQQQEHQQEDTEEVPVCEPEGRASAVDIDYRRLGAGAATVAAPAAASVGRASLVHPEIVSSALGAAPESSSMLRFYLRPEGPVSATPRSNNSWLLQRKLDIIRLRQERREALRRQETLRKLEEQAKVVCSGVSVENSSGAALVEDLLHHHDQLVRRHRGDQWSHREIPVATLPQLDSKAEADGSPESAQVDEHEEDRGERQPAVALERREIVRQKELATIEEGCTILATTCEELLREEAGRRAELSDDMIRAQILLDIDRARTKFCDEATKAVAIKPNSNNNGKQMTDRPPEASFDDQGRKEEPGNPTATESLRGSTAAVNCENRAGRHSMRTAEKKRRHMKIKPSQALVDRVKSFMMPFMLERYPNRGDNYRSEYKRICRHVSESLTRSHEGPLLPMSEAERSEYWALNFVQVQTAVQDYFEKLEGPLE